MYMITAKAVEATHKTSIEQHWGGFPRKETLHFPRIFFMYPGMYYNVKLEKQSAYMGQ